MGGGGDIFLILTILTSKIPLTFLFCFRTASLGGSGLKRCNRILFCSRRLKLIQLQKHFVTSIKNKLSLHVFGNKSTSKKLSDCNLNRSVHSGLKVQFPPERSTRRSSLHHIMKRTHNTQHRLGRKLSLHCITSMSMEVLASCKKSTSR